MQGVMNGCLATNDATMRVAGLIIALLLTCRLTAQEQPFRVMFYNVENLFDCKHDSLKKDTEFLPDGVRAWNPGRLKTKLYQLSQVVTAVGGWEPPALVGLCEVENDSVMHQWVHYSPLRNCKYRYVMTHSPDERGIDVALMWQQHRFRMLQHRSVRIHFPDSSHRPTRDILHVTGRVSSGDSLDVFVCHFPSRSGGQLVSEPARLYVASVLRQQTDSLMTVRQNPYILVMGDFNDYPTDASLTRVLEATTPTGLVEAQKLYNLMADKVNEELGTYSYRGEWGVLDQFLVSGSLLLPHKGLSTSNESARICNFPFLLKEDEKYKGVKPFRTYYGWKYEGGYSDHLPIVLDLFLP